jgi:hypothetical protein
MAQHHREEARLDDLFSARMLIERKNDESNRQSDQNRGHTGKDSYMTHTAAGIDLVNDRPDSSSQESIDDPTEANQQRADDGKLSR